MCSYNLPKDKHPFQGHSLSSQRRIVLCNSVLILRKQTEDPAGILFYRSTGRTAQLANIVEFPPKTGTNVDVGVNRHPKKSRSSPLLSSGYGASPSSQDSHPTVPGTKVRVPPEPNLFSQAPSIESSRSTSERTAQDGSVLQMSRTWPLRGRFYDGIIQSSAMWNTSVLSQSYGNQVSSRLMPVISTSAELVMMMPEQ